MKRATVTTLCGLLLSPSISWAGVEVIPEVAHDTSPPLISIAAAQLNGTRVVGPLRQIPLRRLPRLTGPAAAVTADAALQTSEGPLVSVTAGNNFDGVGEGFVGPQGTFAVTGIPPDTNGAVGNTQYVQLVNTSFAVFNKATAAVVYGPIPTNTIWTGFGGQCETDNDGDGIVLYDKVANRWVISQFAVGGGVGTFTQCVAVSATSDATGSWHRYAFPMPNFNDYPKIAVWPDAYYMSFNMFTDGTSSGVFLGARVCALDRSSILNGAAATAQCFQLSTAYSSLLPSDLDGSRPPPAESPNYFLALDVNALDLWKFHVDFANSANSTFMGPVIIPVAGYTQACSTNPNGTCIPQPGATQQLDSLGDRLMHRVAYRNFGSHETLVANHSVMVGTSSLGVRWYELRNPGGAAAIYQQGTYSPDATYRWMGSIGMDARGNIAVGYSTSSSSVFPSISYTGRLASDPLGTMQAESLIVSGSGSQIPIRGQTGANRWGDYSGMTIDPVDDCTFWYTNEYLKTSGEFNWSTRIASFKFPGCTKWTSIVHILSSFLLLQ